MKLSVPLQLWVEDCLGQDASRREAARRRLRGGGAPRVRFTAEVASVELADPDGEHVAVRLRAPALDPAAFVAAEGLAAAAGLLAPGAEPAARLAAWRDCLGMVGADLLPDPEELQREVTGAGGGAAADAAVLAVAAQAATDPEGWLRWRGRSEPGGSAAGDFYRPAGDPLEVPVDLAARPAEVPEAVLWELGPSGVPVGERDLEAALAPLYRALAGYYGGEER